MDEVTHVPLTAFGTENFGRLQAAMLHVPAVAISNINDITAGYYLFDTVPVPEKYWAEQENYKKLLQQQGVRVYELADFVQKERTRLEELASLTYMHDTAVITKQGAVLSKMGYGRAGEELVVKEALINLGVPVCYEFSELDQFEGFLALSPQTALIACTERHKAVSVENFLPQGLTLFNEIVYVDVYKARRYMHADMLFGKVNSNLALAYLPAIRSAWHITREGRREIADFRQFMFERNLELIAVSEHEQQNWACSFVPIDSNNLIHYDIALSAKTKRILAGQGVNVIEFHPEALLAGGGSLRCLTLMLLRK